MPFWARVWAPVWAERGTEIAQRIRDELWVTGEIEQARYTFKAGLRNRDKSRTERHVQRMGRGIWRHAKDTPMAIAGETALVVVARDGFNARDRTRAKTAKHPLPVVSLMGALKPVFGRYYYA